MECFRCGKGLIHPDDTNADYIIASDTQVRETLCVYKVYFHNATTMEKLNNKEPIEIDEYDVEIVPNIELAAADPRFVRVEEVEQEVVVQKTGIICPDCHKPTDLLIWGVHKEQQITETEGEITTETEEGN